MIDKRLQYDRQMYAMGQRVGGIMGSNGGSMLVTPTRDGSRPGYAAGPGDTGGEGGDNPSDGSDSQNGGNPGGGRNMANVAGPITGPPDMSHLGDPDPEVDKPTIDRKDTITSLMDNYRAQVRSMGLRNAIPGAQTYNLSKTAFETAKAREMLGLGPAVGPGPTDNDNNGGDGQGIMAAYNPYMFKGAGEVEEEVPVSQEEEDFIQRYRVANQFRQDKQGQLDPAILEMISKLYT